jgi:hypothetical protein
MAATTQAIGWRHDYEGALSDAQRQGKLMLLDFSAAPM